MECNTLDNVVNKSIRFEESKEVNTISRKRVRFHKSTDLPQKPTLVPSVLFKLCKHAEGKTTHDRELRCLLDSGASHSLIKAKHSEVCSYAKRHKEKANWTSAGGTVQMSSTVIINFMLPEFSANVTTLDEFSVYEGPDEWLGWDVIIGRDMLSRMGIDLRFTNHTMVRDDVVVRMKPWKIGPNKDLKDLSIVEINTMMAQTTEPESTRNLTKRMEKILDAKYEKANIDDVVNKANALNAEQKQKLKQLLMEFEELFDGTLGRWNTTPASAELKENAKPVYTRHYKVPRINEEAFKRELQRLLGLGVIERVPDNDDSGYGSPAFMVPKPDGTVRFVTDFRKVNATIKRKPFPLPRIDDTMQTLEGFLWASALDMSMGYWTIELDEKTKKITTITTEYGKFRYNVLPMGLVISSDVFQSKIMELLGHIAGIRCYLDDVLGMTKGSFDEHLEQLRQCFEKFRAAGLKVNMKKCSFGLTEVKYLGYIITRDGIKADPSKIEAILKIEKPRTVTEMKSLIGMVQFYKHMWKRRSHILTPLIEATKIGKKKALIQWNDQLDQAFKSLKDVVASETLLSYPDWTKPFDLHADASDYQLGGVLSQEGRPIAFFSRRLSAAQRNYTTTEKELLSIVECLKEFRSILQGYPITVYSDHKNLVYAATLSESQRVMRWRMILEEFNPTIKHIPGEENVVADSLSRLARSDDSSIESDMQASKELLTINRGYGEGTFPLERSTLQKEQIKELNKRNSKLKTMLEDASRGFYRTTIDEVELIMYQDRIYIPHALRDRVLQWFHHYLNHPGGDRLGNTIAACCYWEGLMNEAKKHVKRCKTCNEFKVKRKKYGHLPPKIMEESKRWDTVHVDLIGPYTVHINQRLPDGKLSRKEVQLTCMTMIDPATGWFEIAEVPSFNIDDVRKGNTQYIDKTSARISQVFNQVWLSRYPRPRRVILDNGSEFKKDFLVLLKDFDVKAVLTSVENPQANSPVERVHQVIQNMLATKDLESQTYDFIDPWGEILSSVAWAIRSSYHSILKATPGQIVFGRDMVFNMNKAVDWQLMQKQKQDQILRDNIRENLKRVDHDYKVGDKVMLVRKGIVRKLSRKKKGPYTIARVHTNGTVTIKKGNSLERLNIRRIEPIFE